MLLLIDYEDFTEYLLPQKVEIHYDLVDGYFTKIIGIQLRAVEGLFQRIYDLRNGREKMPVEYDGPWNGADIHGPCEVYITARSNGVHKLWLEYGDKR